MNPNNFNDKSKVPRGLGGKFQELCGALTELSERQLVPSEQLVEEFVPTPEQFAASKKTNISVCSTNVRSTPPWINTKPQQVRSS